MKRAPLVLLPCFFGLVSAASPASAQVSPATGCVKDIECKGDRICVAGQCVDPRPSGASPAPAPTTPSSTPAPPSTSPGESAPPPPPPPAPPIPSRPYAAPTPAAPPPPPAAEAPPPPGTNAVMVQPGAPLGQPPVMVVLYTPPVETFSTSGLSLGLRVGVAFPAGQAQPPSTDPVTDIMSSGALGDVVGVMVPVTLDVGYRVNAHWYAGAYLSVGYGTGSNCNEGGTAAATCYETQVRLGLDAQYNFLPHGRFQPWLGLGAGWEILNEISESSDEESESVNGPEWFHVDAGVDYAATQRQKVGLYVETSVAEYINPNTNTLYGTLHEWFTVGLRYRYDTNWWRRDGAPPAPPPS